MSDKLFILDCCDKETSFFSILCNRLNELLFLLPILLIFLIFLPFHFLSFSTFSFFSLHFSSFFFLYILLLTVFLLYLLLSLSSSFSTVFFLYRLLSLSSYFSIFFFLSILFSLHCLSFNSLSSAVFYSDPFPITFSWPSAWFHSIQIAALSFPCSASFVQKNPNWLLSFKTLVLLSI